MVQSVFSQRQLGDLLTQTLASRPSESIVADCFKRSQILQPPIGKRFWDTQTAGIHIVLSGKVRLFDQSDNLIASLGAGLSFGESTLFPDRSFQPYSARASAHTQVCYLSAEALQPLMQQPALKEQLYQNAERWQAKLSQQIVPADRTTPAQPLPSQPQVQRQSDQQINKAYFPSPSLQLRQIWQRATQRYSFFEQQSASDCGAACLVMVGQYWGRRFSVNRLRDLANVDRNGASLRSLAIAAESLGFSPRPVKASLHKLAEQTLPAIAHWEGKHYIVVYEITRRHVIVGDPAIGQRRLSHAAFNQGWTGYTLLLQPTAWLKESREEPQTFWQFFELLKPHRFVLFEIFAASVLIQLLGLVTPIFTQLLLDRVLVQRSITTLNAVALGMLVFGLFRVIIDALRQYLLDHTAQKIDISLILGFINHTFRLPLSFFESRFVGDIVSRIQENRKIQRFLTGESLTIMLDLMTVFVYLGLMFWYNAQMALLALITLPPYVALTLGATPFLRRISRQIFQAVTEESSYLIQALTGIRTVKSMAVEQTVRWQWEALLNKSAKTSFTGQILGNRLQLLSGLLQTCITTGLLWFGALQVIEGRLTIGQLVAFNLLLGNIITPFQRLAALWNELQEVAISIERLNDVINTAPEEDRSQSRQTLPLIRGQIRFEQVSFRYHADSETNTLEALSFAAEPGQMVALVGRSGSGKTTLAKLLLGLYPPTQGKILIDGYDISTVSLRSLRQQIGVVDQDTFMFGGTIRENISIGYPGAALDDVIAAAQLAGAHAFIQEFPMGYETQIGEGGGLLSGGQRQRIAIARALLGNPRLLILDEATSSLDAESERIIQTNLSTILRGRTTFVIAHRLSTVRHAHLILVLDRGVIVEQGTHDQLMSKRGHYFYLNQQQLTGVS